MKQTTTKLLSVAALLAAAALPAASQNQMPHGGGQMDHSKMGNMQRNMPAAEADMADGEVRKVDKSTGRVTLRHGAIKHMDMPPMTMAFEVKDKSLLDTLKAGDKVKFKLINDNGKMIITEMMPAG
jgi:Cu(I)/Ag(I) efflux system periplasmic protein CusF